MIGTCGTVVDLYLLANVAYLVDLPFDAIQNAPSGPGRHGLDEERARADRRDGDGGGDHDLDVRLRQRPGPLGGPGLVRDGSRRPVLPKVATTNAHRSRRFALVLQGAWAICPDLLPVTIDDPRTGRTGTATPMISFSTS